MIYSTIGAGAAPNHGYFQIPEPTRKKMQASRETRESVIRLYKQGIKSPKEIHSQLGFGTDWSVSVVGRWVNYYQLTGSAKRGSRRPWQRRRYYSENAMRLMDRLIEKEKTLKPREVNKKIWRWTGEAPTVRTTRNAMKYLNYRRKVNETRSLRQNKELMRQHAQVREIYHPRQLCYADEMHKRGRDMRRRYGYAKGGRRSIVPLSPHLGRAWTVLALMDYTGFIDFSIQELASKETSRLPKAVNRRLWMLMFREKILPHLQPCDHRRLPRSVLVIDNCSLHWFTGRQINELQREVEAVGAKLLYIPQYCPRANAIEAGFSQVNKNLEDDIELADVDPAGALEKALLDVTEEQALSFVRRSTKDVRSWL